jgi:hypothetical protein
MLVTRPARTRRAPFRKEDSNEISPSALISNEIRSPFLTAPTGAPFQNITADTEVLGWVEMPGLPASTSPWADRAGPGGGHWMGGVGSPLYGPLQTSDGDARSQDNGPHSACS